MTSLVKTLVAPPCAGCLGSHRCWTCGGAGRLPLADGACRDCSSCSGRGLCRVCRPGPAAQAS